MNHGSLYSGIGGWLLAAEWAGIENVFTCEIDSFCNKVLDKHFPNTTRHYDVRETNFKTYQNKIDILSTSDPCQPFSFAGKRGGKADDRYLWPATIAAIRQIKPPFVVFENVPGFVSMAFETVAADLEGEGYTLESFIIPACGIEAWHKRDRLWIIGYTSSRSHTTESGPHREKINEHGRSKQGGTELQHQQKRDSGQVCEDVPNTRSRRYWTPDGEIQTGRNSIKYERWWETEPDVGRVADGVSNRVDRIKSLGNSIVPQIAHIIFEAIKNHNPTE